MAQEHRVVIVGGGFGGLNAARALAKSPVSVIMLDRRNFHLFQPLLYQVATGGLSAGDIASPLRYVLRNQKNATVLLAEVVDFDVVNRKVITSEGEVAYDSLVVAAGSATSYFGNDSWKETAVGLKTIEEATEMRRRIFFAFEQAEKECNSDIRREWLTFVVVGAGPTGTELAGTLGEIANDTLKGNFRCIQPEESRIMLVDGNERMLSSYPPDLSAAAEKSLMGLGVQFRPNLRVVEVSSDCVMVKHESDGRLEKIPTRTIIWAAGVMANPLGRKLAEAAGVEVTRGGHVHVEPDCSLKGHPDVFVIGDLAFFPHNTTENKGLPGVAPVALQQGTYVGKLIHGRVSGQPHQKPFSYWNKGSLATIGRHRGVADFGKVRFSGFFAWFLWLFIHLFFLVEFQNRVLVFLQWAMQYISFNRGARLITGATQMIARRQDTPKDAQNVPSNKKERDQDAQTMPVKEPVSDKDRAQVPA